MTRQDKNFCGVTGKARFTADEVSKEIKSMRKATVTSFACRVCHSFHLVIRRRKKHELERPRK